MEYVPTKDQQSAWDKATARHNATVGASLTTVEYILQNINRLAEAYVREFDAETLNAPDVSRLAQKLARSDPAKRADIESALDAAQVAEPRT